MVSPANGDWVGRDEEGAGLGWRMEEGKERQVVYLNLASDVMFE